MPNKANAFSMFMSEFSRRNSDGLKTYKWASMDEASKVWETLPQEEKDYYKEKAKLINQHKLGKSNNRCNSPHLQTPQKIPKASGNHKKAVYSYMLTNPELKNYINQCIDKFTHQAHKSWSNNLAALKSLPLVFMSVSSLQNIPLIRNDNYSGEEINVETFPPDIDYVSLQKPNCIPVEITLIEYTLNEGLLHCYHEYIKPGDIPLGYKYEAIKSGTDTNQIPPTGVKKATPIAEIMHNLSLIASHYIMNDIPIYVISNQYDTIAQSLTYMSYMSEIPNPFKKIFYLETLINDVMSCSNYQDLQNSIHALDIQNIIDSVGYLYNEEIRCQYHYDLQCRYCSLRECLSFVHFFSEHITSLFDIVNTEGHTPDAKFAKKASYNDL